MWPSEAVDILKMNRVGPATSTKSTSARLVAMFRSLRKRMPRARPT